MLKIHCCGVQKSRFCWNTLRPECQTKKIPETIHSTCNTQFYRVFQRYTSFWRCICVFFSFFYTYSVLYSKVLWKTSAEAGEVNNKTVNRQCVGASGDQHHMSAPPGWLPSGYHGAFSGAPSASVVVTGGAVPSWRCWKGTGPPRSLTGPPRHARRAKQREDL